MSETVELKAEEKAFLDLNGPRDIVLKQASHVFTYHVRPVAIADWQRYFSSIVHQTLQHGKERTEVFESETALLEMFDHVVTSVDGFGDVVGLKAWRHAVPLKHRLAVGMVLRGVSVSPKGTDDSPALCDLVEVSLDATWSADEHGKMTQYQGLIHRFRQPTIEQLRRFNFESARVKVSGTAENGVTVYPVRQAIAMKIYDELIESIDGYAIDGDLLEGIENIKRYMDGAHKATAALELFSQSGDVEIA